MDFSDLSAAPFTARFVVESSAECALCLAPTVFAAMLRRLVAAELRARIRLAGWLTGVAAEARVVAALGECAVDMADDGEVSRAAALVVETTGAAGPATSRWSCDTTHITAKKAITNGAVIAVATASTIFAPMSAGVRLIGNGWAGPPVDWLLAMFDAAARICAADGEVNETNWTGWTTVRMSGYSGVAVTRWAAKIPAPTNAIPPL